MSRPSLRCWTLSGASIPTALWSSAPGDNYIPGPRFFAAGDSANDPVLGVSGDGRGDVALLNAMGFQASALGNHELDRGTGVFASIIVPETGDTGSYPGAMFPYLSSNLVFTADEDLSPLVVPDGQDASLPAGRLTGSAVITVGGERIGVVGATTPHLGRITGTGGIRDDIGIVVQPPGTTDPADVLFKPPPANDAAGTREGDISQFDIEGTLRFNNGLAIVPLTAAQFVEIIEHSVAFDGVGEVTHGRFPQVGGMRFSFDPSAPSGNRVRSLAIVNDDGGVHDRVVENGELVGDPGRTIKLVTLNFLANGGDDYPFPMPAPGRIDLSGEADQPNPPNPDFPDTNGNGVLDAPVVADPGVATFANPGTEQDSLAEYLSHFHDETPYSVPETPPLDDQRIQNLSIPSKQDTVFSPR